jgi:hypothetical protein
MVKPRQRAKEFAKLGGQLKERHWLSLLLLARWEEVDGRVKPGHDASGSGALENPQALSELKPHVRSKIDRYSVVVASMVLPIAGFIPVISRFKLWRAPLAVVIHVASASILGFSGRPGDRGHDAQRSDAGNQRFRYEMSRHRSSSC